MDHNILQDFQKAAIKPKGKMKNNIKTDKRKLARLWSVSKGMQFNHA